MCSNISFIIPMRACKPFSIKESLKAHDQKKRCKNLIA